MLQNARSCTSGAHAEAGTTPLDAVALIVKGEVGIGEKGQEILGRVRPAVQAEEGDIEVVDVENGVVKLMLQGACVGCPSSMMTLNMGIEELLMDEISEIREVVAI